MNNTRETLIEETEEDGFIRYLFGSDPKDKGSIVLECPDIPPHKSVHLHMFEQLLMIFVSGLRYLWGNSDGKVEITNLTEEHISLMKRYFQSMDYDVNVDSYDLSNYQFKFPNYFKDQDKITKDTLLTDFYYETQGSDTNMYRVSFDIL